jgi:chromosome segregation ATPase
MVNLLDFWKEITVTAGVILTFIAGRKSSKILEKKQQADAISTMQKTYDTFLEHYDKQYKSLQHQYEQVLNVSNASTKKINDLQDQFSNLWLSYSREVEVSQNWEKMHRELDKQHEALNKKYDVLTKQYKDSDRKYNILEQQYKESEKKHEELLHLYEKLKADFEKYKKQTK